MSERLRQQQMSSTREQDVESRNVTTVSNATQVDRMQAIQQLNTWLEGQRNRLETVSVMLQQASAHGVLQALENAWTQYEQSGYLFEMPASTGLNYNRQGSGIFLPTELASNVRSIIEFAETAMGSNLESSAAGIDWNTRLGIPEYRTQSDNLVAPEASCNVTTLAMILERMGIGRQDVVAAIENRMGIGLLDSPESRDQDWVDNSLSYLNRQMRASRPYQRVRGQASMSNSVRGEIAEEYQDNAQMEDLLDMLLHQLGQSRTSVISEPERILSELTPNGNTPTSEKIWERSWSKLAPMVQECIENGGGAALSFRHKGTRSNATHIVSILAVQDDGFLIDDPYGDIRDDYMRRGRDDAYWSRNDSGRLIADRDLSDQKNEVSGIDDWGTAWARDLREEEDRGRETTISKEQVQSSMFYVQLFHRGEPELSPLAPTRSIRPNARPPGLRIQ